MDVEETPFSSSFFRVGKLIKLPESVVDVSSVCRYWWFLDEEDV